MILGGITPSRAIDLIRTRSGSLIQDRFELNEGTSAKWIYDFEVIKLEAQIFLCVKKTKIMLGFDGKPLFMLSWLSAETAIFKNKNI